MTFFGPYGKNHGRSEGKENIGEFSVTMGGRGPSDARFSRTHTRVGARRWALIETEWGVLLTEPERLHCRLRITEPERSIDGC